MQLKKGMKKIALLVNLENKRAFSLYEKLGYKEDKTVMLVGEPYAHLIKPLRSLVSILKGQFFFTCYVEKEAAKGTASFKLILYLIHFHPSPHEMYTLYIPMASYGK